MNNLCTNCKHSLPGHPRWSGHYMSCCHPSVSHLRDAKAVMGLDYVEEAVDEGWFDWPFNFDPSWIKGCRRFEEGE